MSRSGYSDDLDSWTLIRYRGAVKSAIRGAKGQTLLTELASALDGMEVKELVAHEFQADGLYCALGVVAEARGIDPNKLDSEDLSGLAKTFNIANALAAEIMFENDEVVDEHRYETVEICGPMRPFYPDYGKHLRKVRVPDGSVGASRWRHVRNWVDRQIKKEVQL